MAKRRRTRNLELELTTPSSGASLATVFSQKNMLSTLLLLTFWVIETCVVTAGVPGLGMLSRLGVALLLLSANCMFGWYASLHAPQFLRDRRRLVLLLSLTLLIVAMAKIFVVWEWSLVLLPLGVFSAVVTVGAGREMAVVWTLAVAGTLALLAGLEGAMSVVVGSSRALAPSLTLGQHALAEAYRVMAIRVVAVGSTIAVGGLTCVFSLDRILNRDKVVRAGVLTGVALVCMVLITEVLLTNGSDHMVSQFIHQPGKAKLLAATFLLALMNGLFTGFFLVEKGLRFAEDAFDVVTDLRLGELADLNQPILKQFLNEAPGTFHHSQMVGTLAKAGAEAVGANPLLCVVGAHFHDIGKMAKPEYFIENVRGKSRHEGLTPTMSTLIIIGHVKDGIEIAEELGLPSKVIDFIPQHHGTIAVEYFHHQAKVRQEREGGPPVALDDFRYPGPKPQSKEAAILMIADTVEAISRVLDDPNPSKVEAMVHSVAMRRLQDGQLDESMITLREIRQVEKAFVKVLMGAYHGRIKYPKRDGDDVALTGPLLQTTDSKLRLKLAEELASGPGVPSSAAVSGAKVGGTDMGRTDMSGAAVRSGAPAFGRRARAELRGKAAKLPIAKTTKIPIDKLPVAKTVKFPAPAGSGPIEDEPTFSETDDLPDSLPDGDADADTGNADTDTGDAADANAADTNTSAAASDDPAAP